MHEWYKTLEQEPKDGQEVWYVFDACGSPKTWKGVWYAPEGDYCGGFSGEGGFCDKFDAPIWRPRND